MSALPRGTTAVGNACSLGEVERVTSGATKGSVPKDDQPPLRSRRFWPGDWMRSPLVCHSGSLDYMSPTLRFFQVCSSRRTLKRVHLFSPRGPMIC